MTKKTIIIGAGIFVFLSLLFIGCVFIAKALMGSDERRFVEKPGVGLVEVKGMILDSRETVRQLRHFLKKDDVKAVVLRVDSPGGVVAPSQEIYEEVKKFAAKKKIIVSMGSLAASGGYYISAPATLIYANPGTITASIGVIIKLSNIESLMDKIGIKSTVIKTGKFKDSGSPVRELTPEDRAMFQSVIDSTHNQFVKAVAAGRKLPEDEVHRIAAGRVLSGEQALKSSWWTGWARCRTPSKRPGGWRGSRVNRMLSCLPKRSSTISTCSRGMWRKSLKVPWARSGGACS
jgi:protease-4